MNLEFTCEIQKLVGVWSCYNQIKALSWYLRLLSISNAENENGKMLKSKDALQNPICLCSYTLEKRYSDVVTIRSAVKRHFYSLFRIKERFKLKKGRICPSFIPFYWIAHCFSLGIFSFSLLIYSVNRGVPFFFFLLNNGELPLLFGYM